jgi:uncharacterized protein YqhQ
MEFSISTPALLFSAISLLMLAYTNRFLAIANLTRESVKAYKENPTENTLKQIKHFKIRLRLIKYTQVFGVVSFLFCIICMFLIMLSKVIVAEVLFSISLITMATSLTMSLVEVLISISGLNLELEKIEEKR